MEDNDLEAPDPAPWGPRAQSSCQWSARWGLASGVTARAPRRSIRSPDSRLDSRAGSAATSVEVALSHLCDPFPHPRSQGRSVHSESLPRASGAERGL